MFYAAHPFSFPFRSGSCPAFTYFAHNVSEDSGFINTKNTGTEIPIYGSGHSQQYAAMVQNNSPHSGCPNGQNESGRTEIYDVFCNNGPIQGKA